MRLRLILLLNVVCAAPSWAITQADFDFALANVASPFSDAWKGRDALQALAVDDPIWTSANRAALVAALERGGADSCWGAYGFASLLLPIAHRLGLVTDAHVDRYVGLIQALRVPAIGSLSDRARVSMDIHSGFQL